MSGGPSTAPRPGDVLAGRYKVERVLGVGGMGCVVAARHIDLGELRAIKLMLPEVVFDGPSVERFLREARAAVRLKSTHVVTVHDVGRLDSGAPYIVMELLDGTDAEGLVKESRRLPIPQAADIVLQALEGLAEAHANGIVHRDLKPANLFLTTDEDGARLVKILDFGISKLSGLGPGMQMTQSSCLMGSPYYMSPEQMRSTRDVDHRTDIWSMGVILYELITGVLPFQGETLPEQGALVLTEAPPPPSARCRDIPARLDAVVLRCLEKDPSARYSDCLELARALAPFAEAAAARSIPRIERALGARPSMLSSVGGISAEQRSGSSRRPALIGVVVAGLAVAAVAGIAWRMSRRPSLPSASPSAEVSASATVAVSASAPPVTQTAPSASPPEPPQPHASASAAPTADAPPSSGTRPRPASSAARSSASAKTPSVATPAPTADPFGWKTP